MNIIRDMEKIGPGNSIVILGKFDGFHLGHSLLLESAVRLKKDNMRIILFTFDVFPAKLLDTSRKPEYIDSRSEREYLWKDRLQDKADYVVVFPFNTVTMNMEPENFVHEILVDKLGVRCIVAGDDFRFGKARKGDVNVLRDLGEKYGFTVCVIDMVKMDLAGYGQPQEISSTLIKKELITGNLENANRMLGRPYSISGTVIHGKHLGQQMGFPTANLEVPEEKVLPPAGVYYTKTHIENIGIFGSVSNLGVRPSVNDGNKISVETNIIDFSRDVYGRYIQVDFIRFIRPERKFSGLEQLKEQIEKDKNTALRFMSEVI